MEHVRFSYTIFTSQFEQLMYSFSQKANCTSVCGGTVLFNTKLCRVQNVMLATNERQSMIISEDQHQHSAMLLLLDYDLDDNTLPTSSASCTQHYQRWVLVWSPFRETAWHLGSLPEAQERSVAVSRVKNKLNKQKE